MSDQDENTQDRTEPGAGVYGAEMYELEFPAPELVSEDGRGPVLVHAMEGFSDAGHAIRLAAAHLRNSLQTEVVASFDLDQLLDYRSRRPMMTFDGDHFASYDTPELTLYAVRDDVGTPFLLLAGMEPDLHWERFTTAVRLLAERLGVRRTVGLNAIPMAVPHTRPLGVTAHGSPTDLVSGYEPWAGTVRVPASAASLLELRMGQAGHEAMGFAVHVPHYLSQTDYPESAQTLLEHVGRAADLQFPYAALGAAAARVREEVESQVSGSDEVKSVVRALERQYDAYVGAQERTSLLAADGALPSGDELGAELERFLAEQVAGGNDPGDAPDGHADPEV